MLAVCWCEYFHRVTTWGKTHVHVAHMHTHTCAQHRVLTSGCRKRGRVTDVHWAIERLCGELAAEAWLAFSPSGTSTIKTKQKTAQEKRGEIPPETSLTAAHAKQITQFVFVFNKEPIKCLQLSAGEQKRWKPWCYWLKLKEGKCCSCSSAHILLLLLHFLLAPTWKWSYPFPQSLTGRRGDLQMTFFREKAQEEIFWKSSLPPFTFQKTANDGPNSCSKGGGA